MFEKMRHLPEANSKVKRRRPIPFLDYCSFACVWGPAQIFIFMTAFEDNFSGISSNGG
jgi:hypothetical protein